MTQSFGSVGLVKDGHSEIDVTYYLTISYDDKTDEFFALVDGNTKESETVFQIDTTEEMCEYIRTGKMSHIDDVAGLEAFLKEQEILEKDDNIVLNKEMLV